MNDTTSYLQFIIGLTVLTLLTLFIPVSPSNAQNIPDGSYKRSCKDYVLDGPVLAAKCRDRYGDWKSSRIIYGLCYGDIHNVNGELRCDANQYSKLPGGSYKKNCKNSVTKGSFLYADCKKTNGDWRGSSINYKECDNDIWNDNGRLRCKYELPGGSYKLSCRDIRVDGKYLKAECKKTNGLWRYTDIKYSNCDDGIINDNGRLKCR